MQELRALCASARTELLLVAPFIKDHVIEDLLGRIPGSLPVTVVTRWSPEEIAAGVSDPQIWARFRPDRHRRLFLRKNLHAKFYRSESTCLVGSANLTGKALGLSLDANLELLIEIALDHPAVVQFEQVLWDSTVEVTQEIYERTLEIVASLPPAPHVDLPLDLPEVSEPPALATWTPQTRQPEDILLAYSGQTEQLSTASARAAAIDLAVLRLPPGLAKPEAVRAAVGLSLLQMPVFSALEKFIGTEERRFGEVTIFLSRVAETADAQLVWQTMFRWLMYFQPGRYAYRRPRHSELIRRI